MKALISVQQPLSGLIALINCADKSKSAKGKPSPYKWLVNRYGIVEVYDFNYWKRSDPPPIDHDCVIIQFFKGKYHSTGAWVTE